MTKVICGVLRMKKKFYFSFDLDTKILTIQPIKMNINISLFSEYDFNDYPFLMDRINASGETNENRYIEFINVKFSSIGRGCFQAWVPAYILGLSNAIYPIAKPNNITEMIFKGECVDRMISARKMVSDELDYNNNKLTVNIDYNPDKKDEFKYNNYICSFVPSWVMPTAMKNVNTVLNVSTYLKIKSEKIISIKRIIELYKDFEKLFSFACHRQHVEFDSIIIRQIMLVDCINSIRKTPVEFQLFVSPSDDEYDIPQIGKTLKITDEVSSIPKLLNSLNDDHFIMHSFPFNLHEDSIVDTEKYINVSTSFESAFDKLFPNFKSNKSPEFKLAKNSISKYIINQSKNMKLNKKTRKYYESFDNYFKFYEGSLEEKLKFAYDKYNYITYNNISFFKSKHKNDTITNATLAKHFSNKRNQLSHGSKMEQFSDIEMLAYSLLKQINYAMILEKSGFKKEKIKAIVKQIF